MKNQRATLLFALLAIFALMFRADKTLEARVPQRSALLYTGRIIQPGLPITGNRDIRIRLYDSRFAGNVLCSEMEFLNTPVQSGRFSVEFRSDCENAIHDATAVWLEIQINQVVQAPRSQLHAVPYAIDARYADSADIALRAREADVARQLAPAAVAALVPPGTIVAFGGRTAPLGWRMCNGELIDRQASPALFAVIGTSFGGGGSQFRVPDLRGRFLRGLDTTPDGETRDPDRNERTASAPGGSTGNQLGSLQSSALQRHTHQARDIGHTHSVPTNANSPGVTELGVDSRGADFIPQHNTSTGYANIVVAESGGSSETRPANIVVNYIIKE